MKNEIIFENNNDLDNENKDYQNFQNELDKANNFIDYFLITGIEPSISFNNWLYTNNLENLNKNYSNFLQPKILSYFPKFEKHTIAFDESIIKHSYPNGFNLIESLNPPENILFSFILDNNYFNINYPQKYLTCLIFYENICDYYKLYKQNNILNQKKDYINESEIINKNLYIPKCIMLMSLYPFFNEYEYILKKIYEYINSSKNENKKIFIPLDKIIENLLIEIPNPPRGIFTVEYTLIDENRIIKQNLMNELPFISVDLKKLFMNFKSEEIIDIYRYIFLEIRVLFFSSDITLLNVFIYGIISLLFPFQYQYQIITILPKENFEIIESITPFIAGISEKYEDNFFEKYELSLNDNIVIVNIDDNKIIIFDDNYKIPDLPKHLKKKLENDIKNNISNYLSNEKNILNKNEESTFYEFNSDIQNLFFNLNTNLLYNYSNFLNLEFYTNNTMPNLDNLFKVKEFLNNVSNADKSFYDKFINETQIFGDFLYKRMIPKDSNEKLRILGFDEKINELNLGIFQKAPQSIFLKSKEYSFINNYRIQKPRELNKKEINYYKNEDNLKNLIKYGIIINFNNENIDKNNINFIYPIFPLLTCDLFFNQNIKDYFLPINLTIDIDPINSEIVSKSHLAGVSLQQTDMENYINLCWIQMWALTFWYCDNYEKNYRFIQLLNVLEKVTHHEMEIFNLLFETLLKNGEDYMILKLYHFIIKLHLNPSFKVHNIVMKILDKKKFESLHEKNFLNYLEKLNLNDKIQKSSVDKSKFKKRTFKSKYNSNVLGEDVIFYAFDTCINCQKDINLETLSKNFKEMKKDIIWAKCPNCNMNILPKISIQFGNEMNKIGKLKQNTCVFECVVLFSPFFLKNNYNNNLKDSGVKLNVEDFKIKYSAIFWNSIWYFKLKGLDYEIILPYESTLDSNILIKLNEQLKITTENFDEDEMKNDLDKKHGWNNLEIEHID